MKQSTLINLGLILLLGIAAVIGKNYYARFQEKQPNNYLKTVNSLKKDNLKKITLAKGTQTLNFEKENNTWKVGTKSADPNRVAEIITAMYPSVSPILAAQSGEQLKNLSATEDTGTQLTLSDGVQTLQFVIGTTTGESTIVAFGGRNEAYALRNFPAISLQPNEWFNSSIVDFDSTLIKKISYISGKNSYSLVQTADRQWSFDNDQTQVNSDAVNTFVMKFNPLKSTGLAFERKIKEYNTKAAEFSWVIADINGETQLDFYKGRTDFLVKKSPANDYFTISKTDGDELNSAKATFVQVNNK